MKDHGQRLHHSFLFGFHVLPLLALQITLLAQRWGNGGTYFFFLSLMNDEEWNELWKHEHQHCFPVLFWAFSWRI